MCTGNPSTRLYVFPELRTRPLARLVLAHSPSRSAAVSVWTVSTACARERAGAAQARSTQITRIVFAVFVMSALYPRCVDSEPLHASVKIGPVRLKSSRGISNVSTRLGERSRDHRSLEAFESILHWSRGAGSGCSRVAWL